MSINVTRNTDGTIDVSWNVWVNHRWETKHHTARNSTELANAVSKSPGFFVVSPAVKEGVLSVDNEGMDTWRKQLYALSEGAIGVGDIVNTEKYKVVRRNFVTQSAKTFADIVISALSPSLPHRHVKEAESLSAVWREATENEISDKSIKWEMEGNSKYGRRMINRELHIWRNLTMSEFYGGGIVD